MSELGQTRSCARFRYPSDQAPQADIQGVRREVAEVPIGDMAVVGSVLFDPPRHARVPA
jgi:hypothetical protein